MIPTNIVIVAVTLFLALAALMMWKRRRVMKARRMNRGLRGYVSGKPVEPSSGNDSHNLMVA
jgi:hypothetical protein